jgi:hypothetical protein
MNVPSGCCRCRSLIFSTNNTTDGISMLTKTLSRVILTHIYHADSLRQSNVYNTPDHNRWTDFILINTLSVMLMTFDSRGLVLIMKDSQIGELGAFLCS